MAFSDRLAAFRKERGFTQKSLAEASGLSQIQVHRYENGSAQPTLEALKRLAVTLGVTADELVFEKEERGPGEDLRLQFEAISRFAPDERKVVKQVLDSLILSHEAKRWSSSP